MVSKFIALAHAIMLAACAFVTFFVLSNYDDQSIIGAKASVQLTGSVGQNSSQEVDKKLIAISQQTGATVARLEYSLADTSTERIVYVSPGHDGREWLADGYPAFGHVRKTRVEPLAEYKGQDPRGIYLILGSSSAVQDVSNILRQTGGNTVTLDEQSPTRFAQFYLSQGPLVWLLSASLAASLGLVACGVITHSRRYAAQRLNGWKNSTTVLQDIAASARKLLAVWLGVFTLISIVLYAYNDLNSFKFFLSAWTLLSVVSLSLCFIAQSVLILMVLSGNPLLVLRGKVSSGWTVASLRAVQILTVGASILIVGQLLSDISLSKQLSTSQGDWKKYSEISTIQLKSTAAYDSEIRSTVGNYINKKLISGQAIVANTVDPTAMGAVPPELVGWRVVVADSNYARLTGLDSISRSATEKGMAQVIAPENYRGSEGGTVSAVRSVLPPENVEGNSGSQTSIPVAYVKSSHVNRVLDFGFNPAKDDILQGAATSAKSLVVVLPENYRGFTANELGSLASSSQVMLLDRDKAMEEVSRSPYLSKYIESISSISQTYANNRADLDRRINVLIPALIASLAAILGLASAISLAYIKANSQRVWVQSFSGWKWFLIHFRLVIFDIAIYGGAFIWVSYQQLKDESVLKSGTASGLEYFNALQAVNPLLVPGAATLMLISCAASFFTTAFISNRFISRHSPYA